MNDWMMLRYVITRYYTTTASHPSCLNLNPKSKDDDVDIYRHGNIYRYIYSTHLLVVDLPILIYFFYFIIQEELLQYNGTLLLHNSSHMILYYYRWYWCTESQDQIIIKSSNIDILYSITLLNNQYVVPVLPVALANTCCYSQPIYNSQQQLMPIAITLRS